MDSSQLVNDFTSYDLTDEQELAGMTFTAEQQKFIQNLVADSAHKQIRMKCDTTAPVAHAQAVAYEQGIRDILVYLLRARPEYEERLASAKNQQAFDY